MVVRAALDRYVAPTGNYDDALRLTPSVLDVSPNGPGLGEAQVLTIRGFTDGQYNTTFDGIPFADSDDFTHHSSVYFSIRDLDAVSVDRGPGDAASIGNATFGGTVALTSIVPDTTGSVSPTGSGGSFATRSSGGCCSTPGSAPWQAARRGCWTRKRRQATARRGDAAPCSASCCCRSARERR